MVYEMIYGLPPFWDEEQPVMLEKICGCAIDELEFDPSLFSPDCIDFIKSVCATFCILGFILEH